MMLVFLLTFTLYAETAFGNVVTFDSIVNKGVSCEVEKKYVTSPVERFWIDNVDKYSTDDASWAPGCTLMRSFEAEVNQALAYWNVREKWIQLPDLGAKASGDGFNKSVLSYFHITETCGASTSVADVPIEPLMGFLRHPLHHCFERNRKYHVDKNYMYPSFKHELFPTDQRTDRITQNFYFDLGASTYAAGAGGASQKWFVETFLSRGINFDRMLLWEVTNHAPVKLFADYPADVIGKVSYFNVPAKTDPGDPGNPLRILKEIAHADDFVMIKIDIDNDPIEMEFIKQILTDPEVSSRIDELFFEHHVNNSPMNHQGWGKGKKIMNLAESYHVFHDLRALGIRAHSWV